MLVAAGGDVEKGRFSAVGVSHQGYADIVMALLGHMGQGAVQPFFLFQISREGLQVLVAHQGFAGLLLGNHLYLPGLLSPERDFIADDFIFNRVLERSVEHHPHLFPLDEPHLNEAFPEAAVTMYAYDNGFFSRSEI